MSDLHQVFSGLFSVLRSLLFMPYVADIRVIIKPYSLDAHIYADNSQIYSSCLFFDAGKLSDDGQIYTSCLSLMQINFITILLNASQIMDATKLSKTKFLWLSIPRRKHLIMHHDHASPEDDVFRNSIFRIFSHTSFVSKKCAI